MYCTIEKLSGDAVKLIVYKNIENPETRIVHEFANHEEMEAYLDKCLTEKKVHDPCGI